LESIPELQGCGIKVAEGPEAFLFAGVMGSPDEVANQQIEEVHGIIHRDGLKGPCKGQERRDPACGGHACQGLGARRRAVPGERMQAMRRNVLERKLPHTQVAESVHTLQRGH
jgi:hypothetical protein